MKASLTGAAMSLYIYTSAAAETLHYALILYIAFSNNGDKIEMTSAGVDRLLCTTPDFVYSSWRQVHPSTSPSHQQSGR